MGQNHRTESAGKIHLHHNVERDERVVRTVVLPALFAGNDFLVPELRHRVRWQRHRADGRQLRIAAVWLDCAVTL